MVRLLPLLFYPIMHAKHVLPHSHSPILDVLLVRHHIPNECSKGKQSATTATATYMYNSNQQLCTCSICRPKAMLRPKNCSSTSTPMRTSKCRCDTQWLLSTSQTIQVLSFTLTCVNKMCTSTYPSPWLDSPGQLAFSILAGYQPGGTLAWCEGCWASPRDLWPWKLWHHNWLLYND